jgi:hypothetical protein
MTVQIKGKTLLGVKSAIGRADDGVAQRLHGPWRVRRCRSGYEVDRLASRKRDQAVHLVHDARTHGLGTPVEDVRVCPRGKGLALSKVSWDVQASQGTFQHVPPMLSRLDRCRVRRVASTAKRQPLSFTDWPTADGSDPYDFLVVFCHQELVHLWADRKRLRCSEANPKGMPRRRASVHPARVWQRMSSETASVACRPTKRRTGGMSGCRLPQPQLVGSNTKVAIVSHS